MKMTTLWAAAALALASAVPAFAHGHSKKDIKTMNDSAAALSSIDADLSSRLSALAQREQGETARAAGGETESAATDAQDAQILRDASARLKDTRPDLSKKLDRLADKENRAHKHGAKGGARDAGPQGGMPGTAPGGQRNPPGTQTPPAQPQQTPSGY